MRKPAHNKIEQKITQYINGGLSEDEIDELWAEMVQDKHYMNYLKTLVNLRRISKNKIIHQL